LSKRKFGQFIYGRYPLEERWRVDLTGLLLIAGLVPIAIPSMPYKRENACICWSPFPILAFILLTGQFGLEPVETALWGGLLVTLVVAIVGIVVSFPLGILLALGRRSEMPIVKMFCIIFIEFWRGVPLITVLFMSSVMLPLFLPEGVTFDKLLRALIGVALFSSAYMAEVIRGGLAGNPKRAIRGSQRDGADLLAGHASGHHAAGPQAGDSGYRQYLHRPFQGHQPGADHRPVRPVGHRSAKHERSELDFTSNASDGLCLRGVRVLHLLLRHVPLLRLYGAASGHRTQIITGDCNNG
jgi:His/Glu/Gln/Arg/opine family amino acid ABC transporter permease subunit